MGEILIRTFIKNREKTTDPAVRGAYGLLCSVVGIVCNIILFAVKLLAGLLSGSVSIVADAINNLTDASSSVISFVGFKLASMPADDEHPYGHGRYEYLSALTVAVLVLVIGAETLLSSFDKILNPTPVNFEWLTAAILCASVGVKLWMALFNNKVGKRISSTTLIATAKDSRNDVVATLAVLAAGLVSRFTSLELDGYMGVAVAAFIIYSGIGLVKEAISPMLGNPPSPELVSAFNEKIKSYDGVLDTHDLMIHDYGPGRQFASVHVEMAAEQDAIEAHDMIDNIERELYAQFRIYTSIHYDPVVTSDPRVEELKAYINASVAELGEDVTVHDLRIVPGTTHTNVIFDCVVPRNFDRSEAEVKRFLTVKVAQKYDNHYCVITVEHSFTAGA